MISAPFRLGCHYTRPPKSCEHSWLATAYRQMIPSTNTEVIVHCRTGHQANQTFFVLKHLLG